MMKYSLNNNQCTKSWFLISLPRPANLIVEANWSSLSGKWKTVCPTSDQCAERQSFSTWQTLGRIVQPKSEGRILLSCLNSFCHQMLNHRCCMLHHVSLLYMGSTNSNAEMFLFCPLLPWVNINLSLLSRTAWSCILTKALAPPPPSF